MKIGTAILASMASAEQFLYCIYAGGGRNPRALPNNMCCPFTKTEGIKGTPYNAAVNGCCGTRLYDLMAQDCCEDVGRVLDKGESPLALSPSSITFSSESYGGQTVHMLQWEAANSGDSYEFTLKSMKDAVSGQEIFNLDGPEGLGATTVQFMLLQNVFPGIEYTLEVVTINCIGEGSAPSEYTFTIE